MQLNFQTDFYPNMLPSKFNVSSFEFNLTLPSRWSLLVLPIVSDAYSKATGALGMDSHRLSTLLDISTEVIRSMSLEGFQDLLEQSIRPFFDAKAALKNLSLLNLATAKGTNLTALQNESIFDVTNLLLSLPMENISFIFNWTAKQQARLRNYTVDDMAYYRGGGLRGLGDENLLTLVNFILTKTLLPRTRRLTKVSNDAESTGNLVS